MPAPSIFPLFRNQKKYIADRSRLKGWLKARQIGGSTTATLEIAFDMLESPGAEWNLMSRTGRQAEKLLAKLAKHSRAIDQYNREALGNPPILKEDQLTAHRIELLNGSIAAAMPCDADTTVGDACNWLLDEYALFPNSHDVYAAVKPSIRWGKKIRILSSPRQKRGSKFFEIYNRWLDRGRASGWSFHVTNIIEAVRDGCPLFDQDGNRTTLEAFERHEREDLGDELYEREYMCRFTDKAVSLFTMALIRPCVSHLASVSRTVEQLARLDRDLFVGWDIARGSRDRSVIWAVSQAGDTYTTESVDVMLDTPFEAQYRRARAIAATGRVRRFLIDRTGIGQQLAEALEKEFPWMVQSVAFTGPLKDEMSSRMLKVMQGIRLLLPDDSDILDDFNSVERHYTESGSAKIGAPRSSAGHADRFWAAALAIQAAETYEPFQIVMSVASPRDGRTGEQEEKSDQVEPQIARSAS